MNWRNVFEGAFLMNVGILSYQVLWEDPNPTVGEVLITIICALIFLVSYLIACLRYDRGRKR